MIGDALGQGDEVLREVTEGLRAAQQLYAPVVCKPCDGRLDPVRRQFAINPRGRLRQQRAAELGLLVAEDDAGAALGRHQRRGKAGRSGADDEHVAVGEAAGITVGIAGLRRFAETGGVANDRLVNPVPGPVRPEPARAHEGLVVEAGREQRREQVVDGADIERERRPAVLADRRQTLKEFHLRSAQVWRVAPAAAVHGDERVRLLGAGRQDAARPMIFVRAADKMHAVGEQRRGERIAGTAPIALAIERETERLGAIDAAARGRAIIGGHSIASRAMAARSAFGSPALYVL